MISFEKIVIATKNSSKVRYYESVLRNISNSIIGLHEISYIEKPEEAGSTAEENAQIKAVYYAKQTNLPVFSEDEALYVDFLPEEEQPATHVRRINGVDEADDEQLLKYWEEIVSKIPKEKRTGKWHIAYCIATPDGKCKTVGLDHPILFFYPTSKIRLPGWPLSSIQGSALFGKPSSERTLEEEEIAKERTTKELLKCLSKLI